MTQYPFTEITFQQALARARAAEAAELAAIVAGKGPKPFGDIGDMLRRLANERTRKALAQWENA